MLEAIKSMINEKTQFLEAAQFIFEDGSGQNLDDIIVLGEETEGSIPEEGNSPIQEGENEDAPKGKKDDDTDNEHDDDDEKDKGDLLDSPIDGEDHEEPETTEEPASSALLDAPIDGDDPNAAISADDLPDPIGSQTGEEINPLDDLLNVEIDLGSNTVKDVLPVPPANANEALEGGSDTQHVDSGFASEETDPASNEASGDALGDTAMESMIDSFFPQNKPFVEAITIGDAPVGGTSTETTPPADEPPATDDPATDPPAESEVTSAVRDKVSEAETDNPAASPDSGKEALLKKLGSLTKGLEDAKKAVMDSIQ